MATETRELPLPETILPPTDSSPSLQQENEKHSHGSDEHNDPEEKDEEYITGIKLMAILISGTLVQFVMMLDQSIITTV
jgi:hypothetical protein